MCRLAVLVGLGGTENAVAWWNTARNAVEIFEDSVFTILAEDCLVFLVGKWSGIP